MKRYRLSTFLLDTYKKGMPGGTGETFNWSLARKAKAFGRIILAGGLNAENVIEAITVAAPYAVDVSSGIEAEPGIKDPEKLKQFLAQVHLSSRR